MAYGQGGSGNDNRLNQFLNLFPFENREIHANDADVMKILGLDGVDDIRLVDFWVAGQPDPDAIGGTFRTTKVANAGQVVQTLLGQPMEQPVHIEIDIFPFNQSFDIKFNVPPNPTSWGPGQPAVDAIGEVE